MGYAGAMTRQEIVGKIGSVVDRFPAILVCLLFGSAAEDRHLEGSDVDVAVAGDRPLDEETTDDLRAQLEGQLSSEIDLLDLQRLDGLILREILVNGETVRVHDEGLLARFISRMLFHEADMMPNYLMIVESAARAFIDEDCSRTR